MASKKTRLDAATDGCSRAVNAGAIAALGSYGSFVDVHRRGMGDRTQSCGGFRKPEPKARFWPPAAGHHSWSKETCSDRLTLRDAYNFKTRGTLRDDRLLCDARIHQHVLPRHAAAVVGSQKQCGPRHVAGV